LTNSWSYTGVDTSDGGALD
jgi:hypothetical protein